MKYDVIIVGCGFAGSVLARKFANDQMNVLLIDKRNHIGGNMYEEVLDNGVRVHKYGPHIFHTNSKKVVQFLNQYSDWYFYEHRVIGKIDGKLVPIPFNFKSLEILFDRLEADKIKRKLLKKYPNQSKVSILDLINDNDKLIREFGKYVYDKVFVNYTAKQWSIPIEEVDTSVINRVPVILGYDDRYFQDEYQFMPKEGYTKLFENMLNHKNITVQLNCNVKDILKIDTSCNKIYYHDQIYNGVVIYSGALDDLLDYKFGELPYRSLDMVFESYDYNYYQSSSVVNYPNEEDYTRITEFKYLSNQLLNGATTILKEYPLKYNHLSTKSDPYYAILNEDNINLYQRYFNEVSNISNFYLCGRLAEYKYYNMDAVILRALNLYEEIKKKGIKE